MTLLDDFKRFVADAESGTQYQKWAHDNPSDLARWQTFRDELLAGERPGPPTMSTAHGRELVDTGLMYLDATAPPAPDPVPQPAGTRIGNGLLLNAQGSSYSKLTAEQHAKFGGIIVGGGDAAAVATLERTYPQVHGFEYRTVYELGSSMVWPSGVLVDQARQNGWIWKNASGGEITYTGMPLANVADPGFRQAWVTNMTAREQQTGCRRHFLDNTDGNIFWGTAPVVGGKTLTDADVADACFGFLAYIKEHMPGSYILPNVGAGYPSRLGWLQRILPVIDGACIENYDGTAGNNQLLQAIQAAEKDPWAIAKASLASSPTSSGARSLAQAFASVWDGKGGGFGFQDGSWAADPNWTSVL